MDEVEYEEEGLAETLLDENAIASLPSELALTFVNAVYGACLKTFIPGVCFRTWDFSSCSYEGRRDKPRNPSAQPVWSPLEWLRPSRDFRGPSGDDGAGPSDPAYGNHR